VVFNQSAESNAVLAEVGRHDAALEASGHLLAGHALQLPLPQTAMTVQVREGKLSATDGPFMET
jgi:hypothetical protein